MINKCNLSKDHCIGRRRYKASKKTPEMSGLPQNEREKKNRKAWIQCATPVLGKHTDTTIHMYTHKKHTDSHLLLPSGYKTSSKEAENGERENEDVYENKRTA